MASFDLSQWHVVVLHLPLVLFWTALVYDLLGIVWKCHVYPTGHWIVIAAALLTIPTVLLGLGQTADPLNPQNFALATLLFALFHAAFRWILVSRKKKASRLLLTLLSLTNVILISVTVHLGGLAAFGN